MLASRSSKNAGTVIDLIRSGAAREARDSDGRTALQLAVRAGSVLEAYSLLALGADSESRDIKGDSALHWLFRNPFSPENTDMVRLLLYFGASLRSFDGSGDSCMHILAAGNFNTNSRTVRISKALLSAICLYENDSVSRLKNRHGELPYKLAIRSNNFPVLNFLIDLEAFHRFHYSLPIVLNAVTVPAGFYGLAAFGWLGGSLAFFISSAIAAKFSQSTIELHGSRATFGRVWGIVVSTHSTDSVISRSCRSALNSCSSTCILNEETRFRCFSLES